MTKRCTTMGCDGGRILLLSSWVDCPECRPEPSEDKTGLVASVQLSAEAKSWRPKLGSVWADYGWGNTVRSTWTVAGVSPDDARIHVEVRKGWSCSGPCEHRNVGPLDFLVMNETNWQPATQCTIDPRHGAPTVEPPKAETVEVELGDWVASEYDPSRHGTIVGPDTRGVPWVRTVQRPGGPAFRMELAAMRLLRRKGDIRVGDHVSFNLRGMHAEATVISVSRDVSTLLARIDAMNDDVDGEFTLPTTACTLVRLAEDVAKETT